MDKTQTIQKKDRTVIYIIILVAAILGTVLYWSFTFANYDPLSNQILFSILKLDEDVYGDTEFNASNVQLKTIFDDEVKEKYENIIYIPFWVGGNKENDAVDPTYDIALQDLIVDCNLLSPYVKWKLMKNGEELSSGSLDYQFDTIQDGRLVLTPIQQDLKPFQEDKSKYDYYEFYLWLSDSCQERNLASCESYEPQNQLLGKRLSGKIEVELYSKSKTQLVRKPSNEINKDTCIVTE